ncbi:MAG TPA: type II toxin-antitoxin system RelE/ParE family toxin [Anaerolineae bacterium]|nr:type II toxin-antitoxin system RelE/ParE family toxin [Anaerolineae bacterium]
MRVWVEPSARAEIKQLPGYMRQRVRRAVRRLAEDPYPPQSRALDMAAHPVPPGIEFRRLRIDRWRVVYAIDSEWELVTVLAVRRRPPYDYGDLPSLVALVK